MTQDIETRFDRFPSVGIDAVSLDRFTSIRTEDGELIIYDREDEDAWIQSPVVLSLEATR